MTPHLATAFWCELAVRECFSLEPPPPVLSPHAVETHSISGCFPLDRLDEGMSPHTKGVASIVEERLVAGDERRRELYRACVLPEVDVLLRVALTMTAQRADAEDLVQDTLLRAWRSIDTFDGKHQRAWLLTILRNAEINRHRRRRPELLDDPEQAEDRDVTGASDSAEEVVVGRTFDAVVDSALAALPAKFRQVVLLIDVDGLTYAEAADALGVPEGTVMSRLHRARARIRDRLAVAELAPRRRRL